MGCLKIAIKKKGLVKKFWFFLFWVPEIPKNSWVKVISLDHCTDPHNPSGGVWLSRLKSQVHDDFIKPFIIKQSLLFHPVIQYNLYYMIWCVDDLISYSNQPLCICVLFPLSEEYGCYSPQHIIFRAADSRPPVRTSVTVSAWHY